jgi:hypothetical protein
MKKINFTLLMLFVLAICSACGTTNYTAKDLPKECQVVSTIVDKNGNEIKSVDVCKDSIILKYISVPRTIKSSIGTAVLLAVKADKISAEDVIDVTSAIRTFINTDNTYSALAILLTTVINSSEIDTVVTVLEATGIFNELESLTDISLYDCDKALLIILCDYIDSIIAPYENG